LTAECVDDTGNGGSFALADVVEIEHTLDSLWLQTTVIPSVQAHSELFLQVYSLNEASCLVVEEEVLARRA